jgi:hypothetical protein
MANYAGHKDHIHSQDFWQVNHIIIVYSKYINNALLISSIKRKEYLHSTIHVFIFIHLSIHLYIYIYIYFFFFFFRM